MWQPPAPRPGPRNLTVEQTKQLMDSGAASLLDVRDPDEWVAGHIPGAVWIPLGELDRRLRELDPQRAWVVYCHVGSRSLTAAHFLQYAGLPDVANMLGGIDAWQARRFPTERGSGGSPRP